MIPSTRRSGLKRAVLASVCALALVGAAVPAGGARAQEAASAVQDVELQDVTLAFGATTISARQVKVSGTRLSREELLAIVQPDAKEPWATRLARLDAGSLTMPELRVTRTDGGMRTVVTYRDVAARNVHAGRIGELTAAGAGIEAVKTAEAGAKAGGTGTYGALRAEDLDLTLLARLYTVAGDGKGAMQRLYAAFSLDDVSFTDERGTQVLLAHLGGRDFSGRQTPATWNGAMEALGGIEAAMDDPARRARIAGMAADLVEAVSIGSLEASGLSVRTGQDEQEPFALTAARLAYATGGTEPGLSLSDLAFDGRAGKGRIGRLSFAGVSLDPTVATLRRIAKEPGAKDAGAKDAGADGGIPDAELRRLTPTLGTVTVSDLALDLPQEPAPPTGSGSPSPRAGGDPLGQAAAPPLHLGLRQATMSFGPPQDGVPSASRLAFSGLTLPASAVEGVPGLGSLGLYGYRDLDLDLVADTAWNGGTRELTLKEVSLAGREMGTLRLAATIGGIGPEVFDPDGAVSGLAMLSASAKALDLSLVNGGLFERFIAAQAKTLSLKPDELRKEYVTASVIGVPVILGNSAAAKAIGAAMGKFVTKPGTLSISARAKNAEGLGVADVSTAPTPAAVLDKLEVNARAE